MQATKPKVRELIDRRPGRRVPKKSMASRSHQLSVLALILMRASAVAADQPEDRAFQKLRGLVGEWQATTAKGTVVKLSYNLISNDTALVETYVTASGRQTVTIYHKDGSYLLATHYCAQGNQPRLRLQRSSTDSHLGFFFQDATNLATPASSHLHQLSIDFVDADHLTRRETYLANGKDDVTVLQFSRLRHTR